MHETAWCARRVLARWLFARHRDIGRGMGNDIGLRGQRLSLREVRDGVCFRVQMITALHGEDPGELSSTTSWRPRSTKSSSRPGQHHLMAYSGIPEIDLGAPCAEHLAVGYRRGVRAYELRPVIIELHLIAGSCVLGLSGS